MPSLAHTKSLTLSTLRVSQYTILPARSNQSLQTDPPREHVARTKPITTMRVTKSTKCIFSFSNSDMLCSCRSATKHAVTHAAMHAAIHAAMYAAMPA